MENKVDLRNMNRPALSELFARLGEKPFRAAQAFEWLHQKRIKDISEATNLSVELRNNLSKSAYISMVGLVERLDSGGGAAKYLFELDDRERVESVLMRYSFGNSVCVSSQAGCRMGCVFCASAIGGLHRNLTAAEILGQVYAVSEDIGERVSNVVIMGCGEPLDNYGEVLRFIEIINDPKGANIGQRHITLSTCGLADKIDALAALRLQITLAVSLHAPNNAVRRKIMPVAAKFSIDEILKSCKNYMEKTGRRVTLEYALIKGLNSSEADACELARRIRGQGFHVNLIPLNPVPERSLERPGESEITRFMSVLREAGIETTLRRELGSDVFAACGQLRAASGK